MLKHRGQKLKEGAGKALVDEGVTEYGIFSSEQDFINQYNTMVDNRVDWRSAQYRQLMKRFLLTNPVQVPLVESLWEKLIKDDEFHYDSVWSKDVNPLEGEPGFEDAFAPCPTVKINRFGFRTILTSPDMQEASNASMLEAFTAVVIEEQVRGTSTCSFHAYNNFVGGSITSPTMYYDMYKMLGLHIGGSDDDFQRLKHRVEHGRREAYATRVAPQRYGAGGGGRGRGSKDGEKKRRKLQEEEDDEEEDKKKKKKVNTLFYIRSGELDVMNYVQMTLGFYFVSIIVKPTEFELLDHPCVSSLLKFVGGFVVLDTTCHEGHFLSVLHYPSEVIKKEKLMEYGESEPSAEHLSRKHNGLWMVVNGMILDENARLVNKFYSEGSRIVRRSANLSDIMKEAGYRSGVTISVPLFPVLLPREEEGGARSGTLVDALDAKEEAPVSNLMAELLRITSARATEFSTTRITLPEVLSVIQSPSWRGVDPTAIPVELLSRRMVLQGPMHLEISNVLYEVLHEIASSALPLVAWRFSRSASSGGLGRATLMFSIEEPPLRERIETVGRAWDQLRTRCVQRLLFVEKPAELALIKLCFFGWSVQRAYTERVVGDIDAEARNLSTLLLVWTTTVRLLAHYLGIEKRSLFSDFDFGLAAKAHDVKFVSDAVDRMISQEQLAATRDAREAMDEAFASYSFSLAAQGRAKKFNDILEDVLTENSTQFERVAHLNLQVLTSTARYVDKLKAREVGSRYSVSGAERGGEKGGEGSNPNPGFRLGSFLQSAGAREELGHIERGDPVVKSLYEFVSDLPGATLLYPHVARPKAFTETPLAIRTDERGTLFDEASYEKRYFDKVRRGIVRVPFDTTLDVRSRPLLDLNNLRYSPQQEEPRESFRARIKHEKGEADDWNDWA